MYLWSWRNDQTIRAQLWMNRHCCLMYNVPWWCLFYTTNQYCILLYRQAQQSHRTTLYPCSIHIAVFSDCGIRVTQGMVSEWHKEWYQSDTSNGIRVTQGMVSGWHKEWYQSDTRNGIRVTQGMVSGWHKEWYQGDTRNGIRVIQGMVSEWHKEWYQSDTRNGIRVTQGTVCEPVLH